MSFKQKMFNFFNEIQSYFGINDKNLENLEHSEIFPKNLIIKYQISSENELKLEI